MERRLVFTEQRDFLTHHEGRLRGVEVLANDSYPVVASAGFDGYVHFALLNERTLLGSVQVPRSCTAR